MNTTKPQVKKSEIQNIAVKSSEKVVRDFVVDYSLSYDPDALIEKIRKEMVSIKIKGEELTSEFLDYFNKAGIALGLSTHIPVAETVREEYRTFLVEMTRDIERGYDCKTAIEKALAETIASSYIRTIQYSRALTLSVMGKNLSHENNGYCSMLGKELDRANRQFINATMTLKQLKSPAMEFNIKTKNAFIGQNQQFNNKQDKNND